MRLWRNKYGLHGQNVAFLRAPIYMCIWNVFPYGGTSLWKVSYLYSILSDSVFLSAYRLGLEEYFSIEVMCAGERSNTRFSFVWLSWLSPYPEWSLERQSCWLLCNMVSGTLMSVASTASIIDKKKGSFQRPLRSRQCILWIYQTTL